MWETLKAQKRKNKRMLKHSVGGKEPPSPPGEKDEKKEEEQRREKIKDASHPNPS